jgi:hypothetical protein
MKKENVLYEAPTLSAAALSGRAIQERAKAKPSKAASSHRSYGSLSLNRLRGYNPSSSDEKPSGLSCPSHLYPTVLTVSQIPSLRPHTKRTSDRPSVSQPTPHPHLHLTALLVSLTALLIGYKPHCISNLLLVLLLAFACVTPTSPLTPPPQTTITSPPSPLSSFPSPSTFAVTSLMPLHRSCSYWQSPSSPHSGR